MAAKADRLVRELFSLMARYSRDDFVEALHRLETGELERVWETSRRLTDVAGTIPPKGPTPPKRPRKKKTTKERLLEQINTYKDSRDPKRQRIGAFLEELSTRQALPNASDLRQFLTAIGWPEGHGKHERSTITRQLGEHLDKLPPHLAEDLVDLGRKMNNESSTLQSWADMIVKP